MLIHHRRTPSLPAGAHVPDELPPGVLARYLWTAAVLAALVLGWFAAVLTSALPPELSGGVTTRE